MINNYLKKSKKTIFIKFNFFFNLSILALILASISFYLISKGDIRGINADFGLYYRPIQEIKESNCSFLECSQYFNSFNPSEVYERNWVVSPIYTLFFLLPITIFNSDLIFLIQGFLITLTTIILIRKILLKAYKNKLQKTYIDLAIFIGTINSAFIKDSLSSGAMSVCLFFILLAIYNYNNKILFSIFLVLASSIRPNYIFALITIYIALLIFKPNDFKQLFWYLSPSFGFYLISYHFFYSSNPGSLTSAIFFTGLRNFDSIYNYILPALPVNSINELFRWEPSVLEVLNILINNIKLFYMVIVLYIVKLFHSLGFLGPDLIWDHREIFIQRIPGLFYSLLINIPAFLFSNLIILYNLFFKIKFFSKWELTLITWSLLYTYFHTLYLGDTRYLIGIHFIYVLTFLRFLKFIYTANNHLNKSYYKFF